MHIHRFVAVLSLVVLSCGQSAFAMDSGRCSEVLLVQLGKHFNLDKFAYPEEGMQQGVGKGGLIIDGVCKQWPGDQSRTIAAVAYDSGAGQNTNDPFVILLIAIVDQQKDQVVAYNKSQYYLDAGGIGKLRIDTAPYLLSSTVRAFGVDMEPGYSHNCGDGGTGAERTLYVQEGSVIREVLQIPAMSSWRYIKGHNSRCGPEANEEIIENTRLSIEVANSATNGYRDLVIAATSSRTDGKVTGKGKFRHILRYDGQQYPILEMEKPFHKWKMGK